MSIIVAMKRLRLKLYERIAIILIALCFFDLTNLDSFVYKSICLLLKFFQFKAVCPDFYDLPIWEVSVAFGTISAAYYAYQAIEESNKRLRLDQEPDVRIKDRISTAGSMNQLHTISLKNYGKGRALNITATADPEGKISIIEGSNPHSIDLGPGDYNTGWAIDEQQVIKGLVAQGIIIKPVKRAIPLMSEGMPAEHMLKEGEEDKSDFRFYLWYEDQLGNKYKTITKIRHSGNFFKVMENRVEKL